MQVDFKTFRLDKCAAKELGRFAMNAILLDVEGKRAVATDGRVLAVVPVEVSGHDVTGLLPVEAWGAATTAQRERGSDAEERSKIAANGTARVDPPKNARFAKKGAGVTEYPRPEYTDGCFPRFESILPKGDPIFRVAFNPTFLLRLAEAVGYDAQADAPSVTLEVFGKGMPIRVTATRENGAVGVMMPVMSDDESRCWLEVPAPVAEAPKSEEVTID